MSINANPVRGTRDILPEEMALRDELQQKILDRYRRHGFERIETPILENLELLMDSDGGENLSMLFTILKRGQKLKINENSTVKDLCDIGLRYDLTLPLSRFYANNKNILKMPFKAIQVDNVFRAERPQKGRFRSFKQCDIDIIGEESVIAEIELINTTTKALQDIGFSDFTVRINDRRVLSSIITSAGFSPEKISSISIVLDKLDKIGEDGVKKELIEKGYNENGVDKIIASFSNLNEDNLLDIDGYKGVLDDLISVIRAVRAFSKGSYRIEFDPTLVRGMGYYTGQIFEITYGPYGYSIAGGGRYDNMIGKHIKKDIPAVGFSIGFERIITIMVEEDTISWEMPNKIALLYNKEDDIIQVMKKAEELRKDGSAVNILEARKKLNKQLHLLKDENYKYFMVYGRDTDLKKID